MRCVCLREIRFLFTSELERCHLSRFQGESQKLKTISSTDGAIYKTRHTRSPIECAVDCINHFDCRSTFYLQYEHSGLVILYQYEFYESSKVLTQHHQNSFFNISGVCHLLNDTSIAESTVDSAGSITGTFSVIGAYAAAEQVTQRIRILNTIIEEIIGQSKLCLSEIS